MLAFMWRWVTVAGMALGACGHTQGNPPATNAGGAGRGGAAGFESSGTPSAESGAGAGGRVETAGSAGAPAAGSAGVGAVAGSTGGFAPRKPIPCGDVQVPAEKACDGKVDCQLGNDEAGCPLYFCKDGSSRIGREVCDGEPDCPEGEDEADDQCDSVPTGFVCPSGGRVPRRDVCDGKPDCDDGADEAVCPAFLCTDGAQAIAESLQCDRTKDCDDGSDEMSCRVP
jgi:hypothetical protein